MGRENKLSSGEWVDRNINMRFVEKNRITRRLARIRYNQKINNFLRREFDEEVEKALNANELAEKILNYVNTNIGDSHKYGFFGKEILENLVHDILEHGNFPIRVIGTGLNRIVFVCKYEGKFYALKIAIRNNGVHDNSGEAILCQHSGEQDRKYFAKIYETGGWRVGWVMQELCQPAPVNSIDDPGLFEVIEKYNISDPQGGYNKDGDYKLFDFAH